MNPVDALGASCLGPT